MSTFPPMSASDFSSPKILAAWSGYKAAIVNIQMRLDSNPKMDPAARAAFQKLIATHQDKLLCLERAQRIINTHEAICGQSVEAQWEQVHG